MTERKYIAYRAAEMLSWLQGHAPVGQWFVPVNKHASEDMGISKSQASQYFTRLEKHGFIETRWRKGPGGCREFRVLIRLEDPRVEQVTSYAYTPEHRKAARRARYEALARAGRNNGKRPLIRYAGFEVMEAAQF